jgi:ribonuclease VapC
MVVDSSSVIAILHSEPERELFLQKLSLAKVKLISAASYVEMSTVSMARSSFAELDELLQALRIKVVPFDTEQALLAREAYQRYGKSRDKARLNLGDCFSYALAKQTGQPILFKGNDFSETDLPAA